MGQQPDPQGESDKKVCLCVGRGEGLKERQIIIEGQTDR